MSQNPMHEVEKRRAQIARYVARGYSYAEIATLVGVSESQVYKDFKAWRQQRVERLRKDHDAAFIEIVNGLDEAIRRAWEEIAEDHADATDTQRLIATIGKLLNDKAKMLGLTQPDQNVTNVLALVHPSAADSLKPLMTEDRARQIETEVLEGEYADLTNDTD